MSTKIKVLIVDDETQFRTTTQKILDRRGFDTTVAASGEEAVEQVVKNPDVVVLDIKMSGIDGLEALARIQKLKPGLPVIMLTGHGSEPSAKKALESGAFDYLTKPCDIDILAAKINDAVRQTKVAGPLAEKSVEEVMIPIEEYTTLTPQATVKEAVEKLRESFDSKAATGRLMETGHRSLLVLDSKGKVQGILAITDLLKAIMPGYLEAPKPSMADSIQYSPMFWAGMFTLEVKDLGRKKIEDIMSPAPIMIPMGTSLMEAAHLMVTRQARRLVVISREQVAGIVREQDLFFEMVRILE